MTKGRSRPAAAAVAVVALALLAGCAGAGAEPTTTTRAPDQPAPGLDAARGFHSARDYRPTPAPVRLRIPRIGVSSRLQRLGQAPDKTVEVPNDWDVAGWYAPGTRPGDPGSAVILGHVDSRSGPAVFYRLRELRRGDQIEVVRTDRSRARFAVERIDQYDKQRFPTDDVYYPTLTPTLRLVTCGGPFDPVSGHYRANVIVFATLDR
jgi:sortase (surface protein transpeptidase)